MSLIDFIKYDILKQKKKTVKYITAIYCNLHGTQYGGRQGRFFHYRYSLLSLLNLTGDFVCYTSKEEVEDLKKFFYQENGISEEKLVFKVFDLKKTKFKKLISKYKDVDSVKKSDRSFEVQYNKFFWLEKELNGYDYYFWIDAGLSHTGLLPDLYLPHKDHMFGQYFWSNLWDDKFSRKLQKKSKDKIVIVGKENQRNYWSYTVPQKFYNNYDMSYHVIGGFFGGTEEMMKKYYNMFVESFERITKETKTLYMEEQFMSLLYYNNQDMFNMFKFDTWWHEYKGNHNGPEGLAEDYFEVNKSFYKILEEIKFK